MLRRGLRSAAAGSSQSSAMAVNDATPSSGSRHHEGGGSASQLSSQLSKVNLSREDGSSENYENEDEEYGDMHCLVLQGVMAAGYLDAKGVKKLFQEACKYLNCPVCKNPAVIEHTSPAYIQKVVRNINRRIKIFDMMIRSATCEISGEKFYVYLVTAAKPIMNFQTFFSKTELEFFQKIMDTILRKHNDFCISMTECVNIGGEMEVRGFGKTNAEDFIERMICMQYFTRVYSNEEDFEITLGFRTIREFEPVFDEHYKDCFGRCCLCKMIMLNGLQCPRCPTVIHRGCLQKYLKDVKICTDCKGPWKKKGLLVRTRDGTGRTPFSPPPTTRAASQQSGGGPVKRTRMATGAAEASAGGEVDMPLLEPMVSPRGAGASQSPRRATQVARRGGTRGGGSQRTLRSRLQSESGSDSN